MKVAKKNVSRIVQKQSIKVAKVCQRLFRDSQSRWQRCIKDCSEAVSEGGKGVSKIVQSP